MSQRNLDIAKTIIAQLGGGKFQIMTGSKGFVAIDNGVQFSVGRNGKSINFCRIVLNGRDLYDIEYGFLRSGKLNVKATSEDVYGDQLQQDFTDATGLYTRL